MIRPQNVKKLICQNKYLFCLDQKSQIKTNHYSDFLFVFGKICKNYYETTKENQNDHYSTLFDNF